MTVGVALDEATRAALWAAYCQEMRRDAWVPGLPAERLPEVTRYCDSQMREALIMWHDFPADMAEQVARRELACFERAAGFAWKIYAGDRPPNLPDILGRLGLVAEEACALMVARAGDIALQSAGQADLHLIGPADMPLLAAVWEAVWPGGNGGWVTVLGEALRDTPERLKVLVAQEGGQPVAAAYLGMDPRGRFAYLGGGSVVPAFRGRGLYRAMVRERARLAHEAGVEWLAVEARPASRVLLERSGFATLSTLHFHVRPAQATP